MVLELWLAVGAEARFISYQNHREIESNDFRHHIESRGVAEIGYEIALEIRREGARATEVLLHRASRLQVRGHLGTFSGRPCRHLRNLRSVVAGDAEILSRKYQDWQACGLPEITATRLVVSNMSRVAGSDFEWPGRR